MPLDMFWSQQLQGWGQKVFTQPQGRAREEETEAVSRAGQQEGYGRQSREEDTALPTPGGEAWGPGKGLRETVQLGRERGEAWDRQGPRGRFTR